MADEIIPFDLGIQDASIYGNISAAEDFLSEVSTVTTLPDEIEENKPEKVEKKVEKKEEVKPNLLEDLLGEEEEEEIKTKVGSKEEPKEEPKDQSQFASLSKELYDLDVFTTNEGEEPVIAETPEEFLELFNQEKTKGATTWLNNFLGRFGDDRRELFEAIFIDGVNPESYLPIYNEVQSIDSLDLEDESNQEKILKIYYKKAGWTEDKITSKIERLKLYSDLEDEAKTIHPILLKDEQQKLKESAEGEKNKQEAIQESDRDYKQGLLRIMQEKLKGKSFDGIPFSDKEAVATDRFLTEKKWKTPSGELLTDFDKFILDSRRPENLHLRAKIALLALNNFDFSKIEKRAISKESNSLFSTLVTQKDKKQITKSTPNNSWLTL